MLNRKLNFIILIVMLMMHLFQINAAENSGIRYKILFDSRDQNEAEVIQSVMETYHQLTLSVKRSDHAVIIRNHLDDFDMDNAVITFDQGVLTIEIGDTKGSKIEGDFVFLDCSPQIEEVWWFESWLKHEN